MRLDRASRSFVDLVAMAVTPMVVIVLFSCGPIAFASLWLGGHDHDSAPELVHWVARGFAAAAAVAVARSVVALRRQLVANRRINALIASKRVSADSRTERIAAQLGLGGVDTVSSAEAFCFTYGLRSPRIAVSTTLLASMTDDELEAMLIHERYHVRHRDPLKMIVARTVAPGLFMLPMARELLDRYLTRCELAADRCAIAACGRAPLAGAIYKVIAGGGAAPVNAVAALAGASVMDARLVQLESGAQVDHRATPRTIHATVAGMAVISFGLGASLMSFSGGWAMGPAMLWMRHGDFTTATATVCLVLCVAAMASLHVWLLRRSR